MDVDYLFYHFKQISNPKSFHRGYSYKKKGLTILNERKVKNLRLKPYLWITAVILNLHKDFNLNNNLKQFENGKESYF